MFQKDLLTSFISIRKTVRGDPPSDLGAFQLKSAEFRVTLEISSGPSGALGASVMSEKETLTHVLVP